MLIDPRGKSAAVIEINVQACRAGYGANCASHGVPASAKRAIRDRALGTDNNVRSIDLAKLNDRRPEFAARTHFLLNRACRHVLGFNLKT